MSQDCIFYGERHGGNKITTKYKSKLIELLLIGRELTVKTKQRPEVTVAQNSQEGVAYSKHLHE